MNVSNNNNNDLSAMGYYPEDAEKASNALCYIRARKILRTELKGNPFLPEVLRKHERVASTWPHDVKFEQDLLEKDVAEMVDHYLMIKV